MLTKEHQTLVENKIIQFVEESNTAVDPRGIISHVKNELSDTQDIVLTDRDIMLAIHNLLYLYILKMLADRRLTKGPQWRDPAILIPQNPS